MKEYSKIITGVVLGLIAYFISGMYIPENQARLIASIVYLVVLWTNEGLYMGVVSLTPLILFPVLDIMPLNLVTPNYSKSTIYLFLGGFFIAICVEKTNLHKAMIQRLLSLFNLTPRGVIFSLSIAAAFVSSLLSNTTTAVLMMPIAMSLTENKELKLRFALAIAFAASIGGILTPIGTPPNLIYMGFVEQNNIQAPGFMQWIIMQLPLVILMLIAMNFLLGFGVEKEKIEGNFEEIQPLTSDQKRLSFYIIALTILLFINSPIKPYWSGLGLNEKLILLGWGLFMFFPKLGFLDWKDNKSVPYEVLFLFGAGFSIAKAVSHTGLDITISQSLQALTTLAPFILVFALAFFVTFTTEVTSNTALSSVMLPVIYSMSQNQSGVPSQILMMVSVICCSYAFMLPIATPPNAIAMASGAVTVKKMAKFGFFLNLIAVILTSIVGLTYWKLFLG